jgi:ribose transport system ATP-binding protein
MCDVAHPARNGVLTLPAALQINAIGKTYGATVALHDVSFELERGQVCGLLGENGAGKSTLVKSISGVIRPDTGEILLNGEAYRPRSIVEGNQRGVSTAFQELSLVPTLSVALNLFLPHPERNGLGLVPSRKLERQAAGILEDHGVRDISPSALIGDLPLGMRQRIEIVRALLRKPSVLLLDEPTAALSDREWLFGLIDKVVGQGTSILYISHKLDEIRRLCSRCVILRNGRKVMDSEVKSMTDDEIFTNMAGRSVVETFTSRAPAIRADTAPRLEVRNLQGPGVDNVSFRLAPGECLGVAGLEGHGQSSLFKALVGLSPVSGGAILVDGAEVSLRSPREALKRGVALVPEERKSEGIFADLSTMANISMPVVDGLTRFGLVDRKAERRAVDTVTPSVNLSERFLGYGIGALSGGNQQKAVLARALISGAKCLLLFDPTRGVDVGAKQNIYAMMAAFVRDGGSILFCSTELDELVHLCDRCIVMYRNAIASDLPREELSQDRLLSIASGSKPRPDRTDNATRTTAMGDGR